MIENYAQEVNRILTTVSHELLQATMDRINETTKTNHKIFLIGNGGSAALASHFAVDLVKAGFNRKSRIQAISLADNFSLITATANDFSYSEIFSWQLVQLGNAKDLLIAISSSGNSLNIINAIETAKSLNIFTIVICGFDGGKASELADLTLLTRSEVGNYGPVEDAHSIICHYLAREIQNF